MQNNAIRTIFVEKIIENWDSSIDKNEIRAIVFLYRTTKSERMMLRIRKSVEE